MNINNLDECLVCGCVFNVKLATKFKRVRNSIFVVVCPACRHEFELPQMNGQGI